MKKNKTTTFIIATVILIVFIISVLATIIYNWDEFIEGDKPDKSFSLEEIRQAEIDSLTALIRPDSLFIKQSVSVNPALSEAELKGITGVEPLLLVTNVKRRRDYINQYILFGNYKSITTDYDEIYSSRKFGNKKYIDSIMCLELSIAQAKLDSVQVKLDSREERFKQLEKDAEELNKKTCK